ncbi:DUF5590 domain-containing protein [Paenibacillus chartarius]|uniref:DUF5590 domain-containing protein n=1 Tax=Paenibacillus chartarius TaxID=747481 RepID=A0ABV6DQE1_9BACL
MSKRTGRIWAFGIFSFAILIIMLIRFFYGIQRDHWAERDDAVRIAASQAGLVTIESVAAFNGSEAYKTVIGTDAQGEKLVVWIGPDGPHAEKASSGISADQAKEALLARSPGVEVLRVVPGKLNDDFVWELFYRRHENGKDRYLYDYVKFADGAHIDTYRLSLN